MARQWLLRSLTIQAFDRVIDLFDQYYRNQDASNPEFNNDLACEARKRLLQTKFLVQKVQVLEKEADDLQDCMFSVPLKPVSTSTPTSTNSTAVQHTRLTDEIELLTEAFYYFAFRLRQIVRSLPNLRGFECEGVLNVRNLLIEHPEQNGSGIFIDSFARGASNGPVVKGSRYAHQQDLAMDRGLFLNAAEMCNNLADRLRASLAEATDS